MPTGPAYGRPDEIEPGISRFRVWSFGPSRNDEIQRAQAEITHQHFSPRSSSLSGSSIAEGRRQSQATNWRLESNNPQRLAMLSRGKTATRTRYLQARILRHSRNICYCNL